MTDAVKDALRAACRMDCFYEQGSPTFDRECEKREAAVIAAFLRALPASFRSVGQGPFTYSVLPQVWRELASQIEEATPALALAAAALRAREARDAG